MTKSCCWPSSILLLMVLLSLSNDFVWVCKGGQSKIMRLELIHVHSPQLEWMGKPRTQTERIQDLLHGDSIRQRKISQLRPMRSSIRRKVSETNSRGSSSYNNASIELPMHSAADYGAGQYIVEFKVGTPAQKLKLIVDTGSDLTWVKCKYRCRRCSPKHRRTGTRRTHHPRPRIFHADFSSSFQPIPCSSEFCRINLAKHFDYHSCPSPLSSCQYEYSYADGTNTTGLFANETVKLGLSDGSKMKLDNMVMGCSQTFHGKASINAAHGILGLGYSKYSFAMKATANFNHKKFSYCLVDHLSAKSVSSYLRFGHVPSNNMQYTDLGAIENFYAVSLKGISVGGVMLNIPAQAWDLNIGGVIVDSGSTLTHLALPAYKSVVAAFDHLLLEFQNLKKLPNDVLDYCFNSTGFNETLTPKLVFHFINGARFEPPVKSYVIDYTDSIRCLGFKSAAWPGSSTIGNIMQQNHIWEFDISANKLGFAPSTCT